MAADRASANITVSQLAGAEVDHRTAVVTAPQFAVSYFLNTRRIFCFAPDRQHDIYYAKVGNEVDANWFEQM